MTAEETGARRWPAAAALAVWFGVNLLMLSGDFRGAVPLGGRAAGPGVALLLAVPSSLVLTAAAWLAFRLARRRPVARPGLLRAAAVHAAAALGVAAADVAVRMAERLLLASYAPDFAPARDAGEFAGVLVVYALLTAVAHAAEYARRYREKRLAELRLRASLARAELERTSAELRVLRLQVNPHFLFNALHAVTGLLHVDGDAAVRMLARLAELLRAAMEGAAEEEVALADELRALEPFLQIEQLRLGDRLRVRWAVAPEARSARVPHMVLQPLVENAIKHGLAPSSAGGVLEIAARRDGEWLELAVRDDGVGLAAAAATPRPGAGIGTANTRARLEQLYGSAQAMALAPAEGGGTLATVRLPWHREPLPPRSLVPAGDDAGDPDAAPPPSRLERWVGGAAAAALLLVLWRGGYATLHGARIVGAGTLGAGRALASAGVNAALLTLLVAAAFRLARRAPLFAGRRAAALGAHARAAVPLALAVTLARAATAWLYGAPLALSAGPAALPELAAATAGWLLVYALALLPAHALEYARRYREREAAGLRLQATLAASGLRRASAELAALRMRLNPRFLFGSLGDAAALAPGDPAAAERLVVRVADVLRGAMTSVAAHEVALEDELRALEPMLEAARIRRAGLRLERRVDDEALDAFVPHLVLQPLLEAEVGRGAAAVGIHARRAGDRLEVEVRGSGGAPATAADPALAETGDWLRRLYGADCGVEAAPAGAGCTRTVIHLPWHEGPWSAPA